MSSRAIAKAEEEYILSDKIYSISVKEFQKNHRYFLNLISKNPKINNAYIRYSKAQMNFSDFSRTMIQYLEDTNESTSLEDEIPIYLDSRYTMEDLISAVEESRKSTEYLEKLIKNNPKMMMGFQNVKLANMKLDVTFKNKEESRENFEEAMADAKAAEDISVIANAA